MGSTTTDAIGGDWVTATVILKSVVEIFAAKLYSLYDVVTVSYPIQSKHTTILVVILMRLYTRLLYRASYQGSMHGVSF